MVDYSVEYAHIYLDQNFGAEQLATISKLNTVVKELEQKQWSYYKTILIDDYNPVSQILDVNAFIKSLETLQAAPDVVIFEKDLINYMDEFYELLPARKAVSLERNHERHGKVSCSTLIAIWYLCRLGMIGGANESSTFNLHAKHLINIISSKYNGAEKIAIDLLKTIKGFDSSRIQDIFI